VAKISPHEAIPYAAYFVGIAFVVYFIVAFFPDITMFLVNIMYR
jgi:TRAP-type C4-dicarboxylate transport system permease large subunit